MSKTSANLLPLCSKQQLGQLKRLYGQEVLEGIWPQPLPIDNGAIAMGHAWGLRPVVPGHTDGIALPPGVLQNRSLEGAFVSLMIESLSVPVPMVYEGEVVRQVRPLSPLCTSYPQ